MFNISLVRNRVLGCNVFGRLTVTRSDVFSGSTSIVFVCDTCENLLKIVTPGAYSWIINHSPRFNRRLPLLEGVSGRTGIRIHAGNTYKDSSGCILVGQLNNMGSAILNSRDTLNQLMTLLEEDPHGQITIF